MEFDRVRIRGQMTFTVLVYNIDVQQAGQGIKKSIFIETSPGVLGWAQRREPDRYPYKPDTEVCQLSANRFLQRWQVLF